MKNQDILFGNTKKVFSVKKLLSIAEDEKKEQNFNFTKTKEYFLTYFAKSFGDTMYFYEPQEEGDGLIENNTSLQMNKKFAQIPVIEYTKTIEDEETKKKKKFVLSEWFLKQHHTTYSISSDPRANRFYESKKTERKYINLSKGFLHKDVKKFSDFSDKIKKNVETVNKHIIDIWNSGNKDAGEYTLNWFAHALTGHKMETALFLKSGEGTGKSIVIDFLINYVIGSALGLSTSRAKELMKFNAQLLGKIFVVLEELPAGNRNEWFNISDFLKDLITGSSLDIEKKYSDVIQTINLISLIIMTNNENSIKFGKDARRYHMLDISHDQVGNTEYYKNLASAMNKETGEAYFMWLLERYESTKNFECSVVPLTESKIEMKIKNLSPLLNYVKKYCIQTRTGLIDIHKKHGKTEISKLKEEIGLSEFKDNYKTTQSLSIALKTDIPILKIDNYGKNKTPHIDPVDYKTLLEFYKKKGFWSDKFDTFNDEEKVIEDDETGKIDYKKLFEEEVNRRISLENEIKKLKEQLLEQDEKKISISPKKPEIKQPVADDLEQDLLELEKEELLQQKTKTKTKKAVVVEDDIIEYEIKSTFDIDKFFN